MLGSQVGAAADAVGTASDFEKLGIVGVMGLLLAWQVWTNWRQGGQLLTLTERFADVAEATRDRLDRIERKMQID